MIPGHAFFQATILNRGGSGGIIDEWIHQSPLVACFGRWIFGRSICFCSGHSCFGAIRPARLALRCATGIFGGLFLVWSLGRARDRFTPSPSRNSGWSCCYTSVRLFNLGPTRAAGLSPCPCFENPRWRGRRFCRRAPKGNGDKLKPSSLHHSLRENLLVTQRCRGIKVQSAARGDVAGG